MTMTATEFMQSGKARSVNGNSPWAQRYAGTLRSTLEAYAERMPRNVQRHLGPSEIGVECDRQVVGKLVGLPKTNHITDPWPSMVGTALHKYASDAFDWANTQLAKPRWLTEARVVPHDEHPGMADLYDADEFALVDHKFLGPTTLAHVRRDEGPPRKYVVQLLLYGLGYRRIGFPVRRVVLAAYPRTAASLDGLFVWDHELTAADDVLIGEVFAQLHTRKWLAHLLAEGRLSFDQVPMTPDSDECYFCPFYRRQAANETTVIGCPGTADVTTRKE